MPRIRKSGMTLTEVMVTILLFTAMIGITYSVFLGGEGLWFTSDKKIRLQENLRLVLQRVSAELRQTTLTQKNIFDGIGPNNSDSIRFSIPVICHNGDSLVDTSGDVAHWGAPLTWGCASYTCMDADNYCGTVEYKFLEYRINAQNQLIRLVEDGALNIMRTDIIADNITDFQITLSGSVITLTVSAQQMTANRRILTAQATEDVYLRN